MIFFYPPKPGQTVFAFHKEWTTHDADNNATTAAAKTTTTTTTTCCPCHTAINPLLDSKLPCSKLVIRDQYPRWPGNPASSSWGEVARYTGGRLSSRGVHSSWHLLDWHSPDPCSTHCLSWPRLSSHRMLLMVIGLSQGRRQRNLNNWFLLNVSTTSGINKRLVWENKADQQGEQCLWTPAG